VLFFCDQKATNQLKSKMADGSLDGQVVFLKNKCTGHVLDAGPDRNVCQWERNDAVHQQFKLVHVDGGRYHIICQNDGKALDVAGGLDQDGAEIIKYDLHGGVNQQWIFEATDDGGWVISSAIGGRAIDVPSYSTDQGCNLNLWEKHGGDNQVFYAES